HDPGSDRATRPVLGDVLGQLSLLLCVRTGASGPPIMSNVSPACGSTAGRRPPSRPCDPPHSEHARGIPEMMGDVASRVPDRSFEWMSLPASASVLVPGTLQ